MKMYTGVSMFAFIKSNCVISVVRAISPAPRPSQYYYAHEYSSRHNLEARDPGKYGIVCVKFYGL